LKIERGDADMRSKELKFYLLAFLVTTNIIFLQPMGEQKQFSKSDDPPYANQEPGIENFDAEIRDEGTSTNVEWITFFGHQTVGGIRKEDNDSRTKLNLAQIRSIKVIDPLYQSKRYPTEQFAKIKLIPKAGPSEELLIPQGLVICGRTKEGNIKKSWYLNKIDELIVGKENIFASDDSVELSSDSPVSDSQELILEEQTKKISKPVVSEKKEYEKKVVKIVGRRDAGEKKGVFAAFNDVIASIISFFKAIYSAIKRAIF